MTPSCLAPLGPLVRLCTSILHPGGSLLLPHLGSRDTSAATRKTAPLIGTNDPGRCPRPHIPLGPPAGQRAAATAIRQRQADAHPPLHRVAAAGVRARRP